MSSEIGILLGQYAGSQSFENISSWDKQTTQSSLTLTTSEVHSSYYAAKFQIWSGANGVLKYDYAKSNDLHERWYTDVATHRTVCYFWARMDTAENSGMVSAVFTGDSIAIAYSATMQRYRLESQVTSQTAAALSFNTSVASRAAFNCFIDDIIIATDVIELNMDWEFQELRNQNIAEHTTLQGRQSAYSWGQFGEWSISLNHFNDVDSAVINGWWRKSRNLFVTFNSSDTMDMQIVRIANQTNPFNSVTRPYWNYSNGILNLQTVHYSLDY